MDERARRLGANEIVFRAVNERIEGMNAGFATRSPILSAVCECGLASCAEQFDIEVVVYERVRADPRWFIVLPEHELPEIEKIVERHDGFNVIEKLPGGPGELAERHDPRSS